MSASSQADGGGELSGERYLRLYRDEQVRRFKAEQENAELRLDRDQWIDVCRHAEEERDAAEQSRKDAEEQLEQTRTDAYNRIMEAREKVRKAEEQAHALSIDSAHKIVALKAAEERLAQVTEALRSALNANFTGGHGEDGTLIRPGCTCWFCYGHSRPTPPAAPDGPARCGVVGYPQGERHACELERDHADDYHAQGGVRWIGYFKTPPEEPPAAPSQDSERIVAAAIREGGIVFTGPHHHQIIRYVVPLLGIRTSKGEQGFITDTNRFVSRAEAARIAFAAGQRDEDAGSLFSEQLWEVPDRTFCPAGEPPDEKREEV